MVSRCFALLSTFHNLDCEDNVKILTVTLAARRACINGKKGNSTWSGKDVNINIIHQA